MRVSLQTLLLATGLVVPLSMLPSCSRPAGGGGAAVESTPPTGSNLPVAAATGGAPSPLVAQLAGHIWRVTGSASPTFPGAIYIFVPNGTLLETSCKETYRIATWSADAQSPETFQVVEDGRPAFTGKILEATANTLRLQRRLSRGDTDELKLVAVTGEVVCPDLR
jgi:hypothetical protein